MAEKITDQRKSTGYERPVFRVKLAQFVWASGATAAVSKNFPANGIVKAFTTVVNDNTSGATATVAILDEDSYTLYTSGAIAEAATTVTTALDIYVPSGSTVKITPSKDPSTTGMTVDVTFYGI